MLITPPGKILVISLAMNGYQWLYRQYLLSHKYYAECNNYDYLIVNRPSFSSLGRECCWLKLSAMLDALDCGYEQVVFLDADAKVNDDTPPISSFITDKHDIYMAKGISGRYNSGVIVMVNTQRSKQWLNNVINQRHNPIPPTDDVGWGENGHIINQLKNYRHVFELPTKWNNTFDEELIDYVRHYNAGPLRTNIKTKLMLFGLQKLTMCYVWLNKLFGKNHFLSETRPSKNKIP